MLHFLIIIACRLSSLSVVYLFFFSRSPSLSLSFSLARSFSQFGLFCFISNELVSLALIVQFYIYTQTHIYTSQSLSYQRSVFSYLVSNFCRELHFVYMVIEWEKKKTQQRGKRCDASKEKNRNKDWRSDRDSDSWRGEMNSAFRFRFFFALIIMCMLVAYCCWCGSVYLSSGIVQFVFDWPTRWVRIQFKSSPKREKTETIYFQRRVLLWMTLDII